MYGAGNTADYNSWVSNNAGASATDVCAISLVFTNNAPATGPVGCGTQVVTFTVTDECSNASSRSATYRVVDTTPPAITTPAQARSVECNTSTNTADVQSWLSANGDAVASDVCYTNLSWTNNFTTLSRPDACNQFADVTFRVTDPCGQFSTTSARFTIVDTTPPVITTQASAALFECDPTRNQSEINTYLQSRGGATATDSCSTVTWSNNFDSSPEECLGPVSITFTASDSCGNTVASIGSIEIDDTVAPSLANFPANRRIFCSDSSDPATTGTPRPTDACTATVALTYSDVVIQEPDERFCPGDFIITRTWLATDDCGNFVTRDQIITQTIPIGECIPTPCPPCDGQVCCESSIEPVPCNPVSCLPVPCVAPECNAVPCIPVVCEGSGGTPIFDDDDDGTIRPSSSPVPQSCDPIYIYVFDDDEDNYQVYQPNDTASSSSTLAYSLLVFIFAVLALL